MPKGWPTQPVWALAVAVKAASATTAGPLAVSGPPTDICTVTVMLKTPSSAYVWVPETLKLFWPVLVMVPAELLPSPQTMLADWALFGLPVKLATTPEKLAPSVAEMLAVAAATVAVLVGAAVRPPTSVIVVETV